MYSYHAFGLDIRSALPLPELLPGGGDADVEIHRTRTAVDAAPAADGESMVSPTEWRLAFSDVGTVSIRDGREIVVASRARADARSVRLAVLGPAMGVLLQQRGFLVLHASVIEIAGCAVAFLGASGWGKSTLAAALHARGHRLVADDVAAVRVEGDALMVYAGFPQFKLWPDAAKALGHDPRRLSRVDPAWAKRAAPVRDGFIGDCSLPLGHLFLLDVGDDVRRELLPPRHAFLALVRHTYGIEWLHPVSGPGQFATRAAVASRVPVHKLSRPWALRRMPAVVDIIEDAVTAHV